MKISYYWLKEFIEFSQSPEEIADLLRGVGFDVVSITRFGGNVENVVTAKVESAGKHPNADRLSLCQVFDGKEHYPVVCGAPNVAAGQIVPMARVGAVLPSGQSIQKASIRGQESQGMLCSERELGLGDSHAGILVLPPDTLIGQSITDVLQLGDAVLDVEVTPNRPDVLSHWGIAREIASALKKELRLPEMNLPDAKKVDHRVRIEENSICSRYIGRIIRGMKVGPSPLLIRLRLERCGLRAINNVVDVTNYVLLELGHPLHAFDLDRLTKEMVVVRLAHEDESLECLDGVKRSLGQALIIADAEKPAAIAGIIGGSPSAVSDSTTNILLESAHFQPASVRRTRKALNVVTESSYRFERGTDPTVADWTSRRAAFLLLRLAGGTLVEEQDAGKPASVRSSVHAVPQRINALLGTEFKTSEMKSGLESLGFSVKGDESRWEITPPVHRQDIREEPDVAEEVARSIGYARVPARIQRTTQMPQPPSRERVIASLSRATLQGFGFDEACNVGLLSRQLWTRFEPSAPLTGELDNPLSSSGEVLPPSLLPGLLQNIRTNLRYGTANVRLYEIAHVFRREPESLREATTLAWVACGATHEEHWKHKPRPLEIWDAKSFIDVLLDDMRLSDVRVERADGKPYLHPAECLSIHVGSQTIGVFGRLHPRLAEEWELPAATFVAEIDLSLVATLPVRNAAYRSLPKYPAVYRDFSLVFPNSVPWSAVVERLGRQFKRVEKVEPFDVFIDPSLPPDHRSLAFRVSFRDPGKTLTDTEVGEIQKAVVQDLEKEFHAQLRATPLRPTT